MLQQNQLSIESDIQMEGTQVWKKTFSRILGGKTPLFNRNPCFWGPVEHPFLSKTRLFFLYMG